VVVATDSQRISSSGVSQAPFNKTFKLRGGVLGAWVGLMEASSKSIAEHLAAAVGVGAVTITSAAQLAVDVLTPILTALPDSEVALRHRRLDLLLASRAGIRSVGFFPEIEGHRLRTEIKDFTPYAAAGEEGARQEVMSRLAQALHLSTLGVAHLRRLTTSVASSAIAESGPHPHFPMFPGCCEPVNVLSLPDVNAV
jgi:hypothetical protein